MLIIANLKYRGIKNTFKSRWKGVYYLITIYLFIYLFIILIAQLKNFLKMKKLCIVNWWKKIDK